jgi:hypothetical protein
MLTDECARECLYHDPFNKLSVIIDSRMENLRINGRTLFDKLYKKAGESVKANADASIKNNPWLSISKVWG